MGINLRQGYCIIIVAMVSVFVDATQEDLHGEFQEEVFRSEGCGLLTIVSGLSVGQCWSSLIKYLIY